MADIIQGLKNDLDNIKKITFQYLRELKQNAHSDLDVSTSAAALPRRIQQCKLYHSEKLYSKTE